jgi:peptide/nickel transport system ATP-binding protein
MKTEAEYALEVEDLSIRFPVLQSSVHAVDSLSFKVARGEVLGVVGESGCGKSVTALGIMRLLKSPPAHIVARSVRVMGRELSTLSEDSMRLVRGNDVAMIFQEPMSSLNPVLTIGEQIAETLTTHRGMSWRMSLARAVELLSLVRIPDARQRIDEYPHQLSGGMRQRVMIAMALACEPKLLIADEPTTALDVTTQAQIIRLLQELQQRFGMAVVLITHDLGVVGQMAHRVVVMYAGCKVEEGPIQEIFAAPRHPYTVGLMRSRPRLGSSVNGLRRDRLLELPGHVPTLAELSSQGCLFAPRCVLATDKCRNETPPLLGRDSNHVAACWRSDDLGSLLKPLSI